MFPPGPCGGTRPSGAFEPSRSGAMLKATVPRQMLCSNWRKIHLGVGGVVERRSGIAVLKSVAVDVPPAKCDAHCAQLAVRRLAIL